MILPPLNKIPTVLYNQIVRKTKQKTAPSRALTDMMIRFDFGHIFFIIEGKIP